MIKVYLARLLTKLMALYFWRGQPQVNLNIQDHLIPLSDRQIKARVYTPLLTGPHPVIVYFHGGGFVLGDLGTVDGVCRDIAASTGHMVVSVDYRLAPEAPFPAAVDDCIAAIHWVSSPKLNIDVSRIFVAGDSAGGNLAAVTALHLRQNNQNPIRGQILIYPVTHHYSNDTPSYREKANGFGLTRNMMVWFWDLYYRDSEALEAGQVLHAMSTPLAEEDLAGLPPALILTAEHDPLRDESIEYANRLAEAGVAVQQTCYAGAQHGFFGSMGPTADYKKGLAEISSWLSSQS